MLSIIVIHSIKKTIHIVFTKSSQFESFFRSSKLLKRKQNFVVYFALGSLPQTRLLAHREWNALKNKNRGSEKPLSLLTYP